MKRLHGWRSLSRRLPLLISGLLIAALAAFAFVGYQQLTGALMATATSRVESASRLLGRTFETTTLQLRVDLGRTVSDTSVQQLFRANNSRTRAAAERVIAEKLSKNAQVIGIELLGKDGKRVLWVDGPAAAKAAPLRASHVESAPTKGLIAGPLVADRGTIFYEMRAPIIGSSGDTLGTAAQFREVSSAAGMQLVADLIGSDVTLLFGNITGTWTDLSKIVKGPPVTAKSRGVISYTPSDGSPRLGAWAPMKLTPWVVWVDIRTNAILAPAQNFLVNMELAGLLILVLGALGAWLISRPITGPLREIALAATGISEGNYSRRAIVSGGYEMGFLADAFNGMANQIDASHHELEDRVVARTSELQSALAELKEAQESLVRKEKLAMLGLLAGGVGHELRNPLGVMTNAVYYLGAVLKQAPAEVTEYLAILRTQITLAEKIVGDLLDFARIKPPQFEVVSLKHVVDEQLTRAGALDGVTVTHDFPSDLPQIRVDRVQIGQVVLNLITNALQAMNGNAALTFRARRGSNGFVRLDVIDTGSGITPEQMGKLFEPLFTTKARGIGLGLAVSRSLLQANGGVISVESIPGKGTTMSISLPAAHASTN
ncbi:MAG: two-component system, NtrC family, sensor kinase [Gemmatimonadaceae bacterium]|jgi:signal transduction histidine kinase|nr:two-component system, NtrC family, sensor kinase [Gemmatimonadaceae bacterium]